MHKDINTYNYYYEKFFQIELLLYIHKRVYTQRNNTGYIRQTKIPQPPPTLTTQDLQINNTLQ